MIIRTKTLSETSDAVEWTFSEADDCICERVVLKFDAAPTTSENITITVDSADGVSYDHVVSTHDPSSESETTVVVTLGTHLADGDQITVEYTNTDGNEITGIAYLSIS